MDKYELIEVLRAAADGIERRDSSKELKVKLDSYKKLCYILLRSVARKITFSQRIGTANRDRILEDLSEISNIKELDPLLERNIDETFRAITGGDEPPKDM